MVFEALVYITQKLCKEINNNEKLPFSFLRIVFKVITSDEKNFGLFYRSGKMLEIIWCQEPIVIGSYRCRLGRILNEATRERKELLTHSQVQSRVSRTRSL